MASNVTKMTHSTVRSDVAYVYDVYHKAKKTYRATCAAFVTLHPNAYKPTATPWMIIENIEGDRFTALVSFYDARSEAECDFGNLIMRIRFRNVIGWEQKTWDQFEQLVCKFVNYDTSPEMTQTAVNLIKSVLDAR